MRSSSSSERRDCRSTRAYLSLHPFTIHYSPITPLGGPNGAAARRRILVRFRLHLFVSERHAHRSHGGWRRRRRSVAAVPAWADLRRARLDEFALHLVSRQGPLHVAGYGTGGRSLANSVLPASCVSAEQPAGGSGRSSWRGSWLGGGLHARRLLEPNSPRGGRSPSLR